MKEQCNTPPQPSDQRVALPEVEDIVDWLLERCDFGEGPSVRSMRGAIVAAYERGLAARSETACSETSPHGLWVVWYEDPAKEHEVFFGDGSEAAARARYKSAYDNWS